MPAVTLPVLARLEAAKARIETLTSLRRLLGLPRENDLTDRQWRHINGRFAAQQQRLMDQLMSEASRLLPQIHEPRVLRKLNAMLGRIELDLAKALTLFDTYMDVLTQRHPQPLGRLLVGCDVLARDSLLRNHPALLVLEPPLVYCDRGFGASTLRSDIPFPVHGRNPMPLIQIPYSRLKEKYNLTSILHEAGHEAMVRLGLRAELPEVLRRAATRAGIGNELADLFALWSSEIGPDFWSFCGSGLAAAGTTQEILALPPEYVFRIQWNDPHPPPWLRVLLVCHWCRHVWGQGPWDDWEQSWLNLYPLAAAPTDQRTFLQAGRKLIPAITAALINTKFRTLGGYTITSLFDLTQLAPARLERRITAGRICLRGLSPCAQLAVFRLAKEQRTLSEAALDTLMTDWLHRLALQRHSFVRPLGMSQV